MTSGSSNGSGRVLIMGIVGLLLILAGIMLVVMPARELQHYRAALASHGGNLINLGADAQPRAGQHGATVRVVATPAVVEAPRDIQFNLQVDTPVLVRQVEMFQWREIRIGDSLHYELDWVAHPLDAAHFEHPAGHANPPQWPIKSQKFVAGRVQMGGFTLSPALVRALPGSTAVTPDTRSLPPNLAASFSAYGNHLVTSRDPRDPQLGDLRVSWTRVPAQTMTLVARVNGDRLEAGPHQGDARGYRIELGDVSLPDVFPDVPLPPGSAWPGRIIAVLLAWLGTLLLLWRWPRRRDPWLALGIGSVLIGLIASACWLQASALAVGGWLALALLGAGLAAWRARRSL